MERELESVERELLEARARFELALIAGEVGTFVWEVGDDRVFGDRNFAALFGLAGPDVVAPLADFLAAIHVDDRDATLAAIRHSLETGADYRTEYRIVRGETLRWVSARGRIERDAQGGPGRFAGVLLDITERKQAEHAQQELARRYEQHTRLFDGIASTTPDFIYIFDLRGNILYANRRLLEVWGKTFDEAVGRSLLELGYPDWHAAMHLREIEQVIRTKQAIRGTVPFTGGSGIHGIYEYIFTPVLDSAGEVELIAGTTRDVTERNRTEVALREAREQAELASRLKDEFLATLSHELRTPLNAILGWSQLLRRRSREDARLHEGFGVIERNARVQVQLIEDLLDMSRIVAGKLRLDVKSVELRVVIQAALESVAPAAQARGVKVQVLLDDEVGPVRGDPARLQQVIWNLLANAIKFTPRGGVVTVDLARQGAFARLSVSDSGMGIEPDFLPYVFERFRQSEGGSTRRHQGLGLGLGIVKSLVEMHGGQVRAQSEGRGKGASFVVELPWGASEASVPHELARPSRAIWERNDELADERALRGVSVLVVDDELDMRELVAHVLTEVGAHVLCAASAAEAFRLLRSELPDVLLSDIGMPDEDGYALMRRVRELPAGEGGDTPSIALTAFARSEDRQRALTAGFQSHLAKPIESAELVAVVASVAAGSRAAGSAERVPR
ncbi:MAG: ATP-binding protein [Polyangiales bacterium]